MLLEKEGNLQERRENLTLMPCYLDTSIIINATLESDPEWQRQNKNDYYRKKEEIGASYKLLHEWNPDILFTSRYTVAEFFERGRYKFKKTFDELNTILRDDILANCKLLPARFSNVKIPIGIGLEDNLKALEINWEYENFDEYLIILKDGASSKGRTGGQKNLKDNIFNLEGKNLRIISYEFPFLEYILFNEICKLDIDINIGLKDILHLIYAKYPPVIFLVTHDDNLLKAVTNLKSNDYYSVKGKKAKELILEYL